MAFDVLAHGSDLRSELEGQQPRGVGFSSSHGELVESGRYRAALGGV